MGNRICKIVKPKDPGTHLVLDQRDWTYTYYTHDASGNVMAVYDRDLSDNGSDMDDKITLKEQDLYASSRVGLKRPLNDDGSAIVVSGFTFTPGTPGGDGIIPVSATVGSIASSSLPSGMRWITRKQYELSNHLGNVYAVVSDKKIGNANSLSTTAVAYYTADVISATDYFAFGAPENGREFSSTDYRYGFNGKENDPQTVGTGEGTQDYGMRIYNPGLGRFLSADPAARQYPDLSTYCFAANTPISCIDILGAGPGPATGVPGMRAPEIGSRATFETILQQCEAQSGRVLVKAPIVSGGGASIGTYANLFLFIATSFDGSDPQVQKREQAFQAHWAQNEQLYAYAVTTFNNGLVRVDRFNVSLDNIKKGTATAADFAYVNSVYRNGLNQMLNSIRSRHPEDAFGLQIEDHHIIPQQLKLDPVVQAAMRAGYQFEGDQNKIPLPNFIKGGPEEWGGKHANHPAYNNYVLASLKTWAEANPGYTDKQAYEFISNFSNYLRMEIISNPKKVNDLGKDLAKAKAGLTGPPAPTKK